VRQPTPKRAEAAAAQPASADADPVAPPRPVAGAPAPSQAPQRRVSELAAAVERRIEASPAPAPAIGSDLDRAPVLPPRKLPPGPSQLPPAVFRELPQARVLVHVYVEQPAQRFVILNSRKLREGDASPEGLQMEEIVPEGVILSFQGHRFFIPR
jgi:general secretion pathway protein B